MDPMQWQMMGKIGLDSNKISRLEATIRELQARIAELEAENRALRDDNFAEFHDFNEDSVL